MAYTEQRRSVAFIFGDGKQILPKVETDITIYNEDGQAIGTHSGYLGAHDWDEEFDFNGTPTTLAKLFPRHAALARENLEEKVSTATARADAAAAALEQADKDAANALAAERQKTADALAQVATLTATVAEQKATIEAGSLSWDAARTNLRQATAEANGYINWADVVDSAEDEGSKWHPEASAIVAHDAELPARMQAARDAGQMPFEFAAAEGAWKYDGTPDKADPAAPAEPADAQA